MPRIKRAKSQFPAHLIRWYWNEVREILVKDHGVSKTRALKGIRNYRRALDSVGVGDIQYHAGTNHTAEGIVNGGHLP